MNRKYNPYVSLVALLLLALILVLTCTGCHIETEAAENKPEPGPRFTVEDAGNNCKIITDTETGAQYLYYFHSYNSYKGGSGLTKLEG